MDEIKPAFGIYIHWPFCAKKCPYCDFNSHVQDAIDHDLWLKAYLRELRYYAAETSDRLVTSVFFGGGTPSLMKPQVIEDILAEIGRLWDCSEDFEITAEANPSSSETRLFQDFRQAGINRLSIGVQSFNDQALQFLGRLHDAAEARKAVESAAKIFDRLSFDLIYALPGQTPAEWQRALGEALTLAPDHLSLYQLTIEPGTVFHQDRVAAADEDIGTELYEITQGLMDHAGLPAYEISNHARETQESRHNLVYWRGQDYLGIGPGAHGRLTRDFQTEMIQNVREPGKWLELAQTKGLGQHKRTPITAEERRDEILLMGLRLTEGVSADHYHTLTGTDLASSLDQIRLQALENEGFITFRDNILKATPAGRQRLNAVLAHLLS
tara:strand:- start:6671 stop:7819 length:1149 start_codon:yes stop_codon:yes gene_type:complete